MILGSFGVYDRCIIEWCSSFRALRYLKITIAPLSQTRDGGRMISKSNFASAVGPHLSGVSVRAASTTATLAGLSPRAPRRPGPRPPPCPTAGARPRAPRGSPARILAIAYWALGRPPIAIRHCGPLRGCGPSRDPAARSDPRCRCRTVCTPRSTLHAPGGESVELISHLQNSKGHRV